MAEVTLISKASLIRVVIPTRASGLIGLGAPTLLVALWCALLVLITVLPLLLLLVLILSLVVSPLLIRIHL